MEKLSMKFIFILSYSKALCMVRVGGGLEGRIARGN